MRKRFLLLLGTLTMILGTSIVGYAQMSSTNYAITTTAVSGGGGPMSSTNYQTNTTLGQPSPLMDSATPPYSTSYDLYPGFWYTLDAIVGGCLWDIEPEQGDGDVDGSDLAEMAANYGSSGYGPMDLADFVWEFGENNCP